MLFLYSFTVVIFFLSLPHYTNTGLASLCQDQSPGSFPVGKLHGFVSLLGISHPYFDSIVELLSAQVASTLGIVY